MSQCPHCQRTTEQVKVGCNPSGSQRYLCKVCQRKYTPEPKEQGYPDALRQQALQLYVDGVNFRRIGRILSISHQTVANWVTAYADHLPAEPPCPAGQLEVNELDELFTFVSKKKTSFTSSPK
jgi:transposase-like protein